MLFLLRFLARLRARSCLLSFARAHQSWWGDHQAPLPPPDRKRSVDLSTIKNKAKRSEVFQRQREEKRKDQRQERRIRKREREELGDAVRHERPDRRRQPCFTP